MSADSSDELDLIRRLLAGDRDAWCRFVERYSGVVYSAVGKAAREWQVSVSSGDREDLCAEVFAELLHDDCRALRRFRGHARLSTWLVTITRRTCHRHFRRRWREPLSLESPSAARDDTRLSPQEPATSDSSDALRQLIRREERGAVRQALQQLKPSDRQVLQLFYAENLPYAEIGRRLGISINTVGPKLHRAQRRLQRLLQPKDIPASRFR